MIWETSRTLSRPSSVQEKFLSTKKNEKELKRDRSVDISNYRVLSGMCDWKLFIGRQWMDVWLLLYASLIGLMLYNMKVSVNSSQFGWVVISVSLDEARNLLNKTHS